MENLSKHKFCILDRFRKKISYDMEKIINEDELNDIYKNIENDVSMKMIGNKIVYEINPEWSNNCRQCGINQFALIYFDTCEDGLYYCMKCIGHSIYELSKSKFGKYYDQFEKRTAFRRNDLDIKWFLSNVTFRNSECDHCHNETNTAYFSNNQCGCSDCSVYLCLKCLAKITNFPMIKTRKIFIKQTVNVPNTWSKESHHKFPIVEQQKVLSTLLCLREIEKTKRMKIQRQIMHHIFDLALSDRK